jgi:hypothetical protein
MAQMAQLDNILILLSLASTRHIQNSFYILDWCKNLFETIEFHFDICSTHFATIIRFLLHINKYTKITKRYVKRHTMQLH